MFLFTKSPLIQKALVILCVLLDYGQEARRGHQIPEQVGNWTWILSRSSQCSEPLTHLSNPCSIFGGRVSH